MDDTIDMFLDEPDLNDEQESVASNIDENLILFASAGTGKTFTIANRIKKILLNHKCLPSEILCLTFTVKAANEMKDSILTLIGEDGKFINISTIHSLCFKILKYDCLSESQRNTNPQICDDVDQFEIMKNVLIELGAYEKWTILSDRYFLQKLIEYVKQAKETLSIYDVDEKSAYNKLYEKLKNNPEFKSIFERSYSFVNDQAYWNNQVAFINKYFSDIFAKYQEELDNYNLFDYTDLICLVHKLFKDEKKKAFWNSRFKYIFIDEMQDISMLEYDTLKSLFVNNNIMMCGDLSQTIYEWRGSKPFEIISDFENNFDPHVYMFNKNYRSTQLLCDASFSYLKNAFPTIVGKYYPASLTKMQAIKGKPIYVVDMNSFESEAIYIYTCLERMSEDQRRKTCIMARTRRYIAELYNLLSEYSNNRSGGKIRFFTVDSEIELFKKPVIKDILAVLSIMITPMDSFHVNRIAERYIDKIGKETIKKIEAGKTCGYDLSMSVFPLLTDAAEPYLPLINAYYDSNIVVYDTETTGLDIDTDEIIQISAIKISRDKTIIDSIDLLIVPTIEISKGALQTHHKTKDYILTNGGKSAYEALKLFSDFVRGSVLVGHNSLCFDSPLVSRQLKECHLPELNIIAEYDTMMMAKQFYPDLANYKLSTLCEKFGIINENAHDAMGDITATGKALMEMITNNVIPNLSKRKELVLDMFEKLYYFKDFISTLRNKYLLSDNTDSLIDDIVRYLKHQRKSKINNSDMLFIESLKEAFSEYKSIDMKNCIRSFLNNVSLSGSQIDALIKKTNRIPIITIHQSKGCEYDNVFLAGAGDKIFPSYQALKSPTALEEEKRLFYVAISRAKKVLVISYCKEGWTSYPITVSPFVEYIPSEYIRHINKITYNN